MNDEAELPSIVKYSEQTSFHGMKYVFRTKQNIVNRLFWIIILTILIFILGYFVYSNVTQFLQFSLNIQENSLPTNVFEIPFPAITICPAHKVQNVDFSVRAITEHFLKYVNQSANEGWNSEYGSMLLMATQVCGKTLSNIIQKNIKVLSSEGSINISAPTELNDKIIRTLHAMSPRLQKSIIYSVFTNWYDKELADENFSDLNVHKLFTSLYTNDGICFTFNIIPDAVRPKAHRKIPFVTPNNFSRFGWHPETGYSKHKAYPFKGIVRGKNNKDGLGIQLKANFLRSTEFCLPSNLGYKLILHSPSAYPHTYENFISLEYDKEYTIAIKPETISTAMTLRSIRPETRKCYFNDERQLKYYTFYNENNCKLECYANYTLKMFGGFPFWAPRDTNIPVAVLKSHNYGWYLNNYFGSMHAYNQIYKNAINLNSTYAECNCLPECNLIRYDYEVIDINVEILRNIREKYNQNVSETHLAIIYQEPTFMGKQRIAEYTFISLVSEFGKLLGLFIGGSILSIVELIYFLVVRNFCKLK